MASGFFFRRKEQKCVAQEMSPSRGFKVFLTACLATAM